MSKGKVALVLSSGGARGMAHIGVIEELLDQGYEISSIAGCSVGALVGAAYASGQLDSLKNWMCNLQKLDVYKLLDFTLGQGLIKGNRVFGALKKEIEDVNIETFPIPFVAVAVHVHNKAIVHFTEGSMFEAIRASVAIPSIVLPYNYNDQLFIDGGVMNPLPIDAVSRTPGDMLIVVDLNSKITFEPPMVEKKEVEAYLQLVHSFKETWRKVFPTIEPQVTPDKPLKKYGIMDLFGLSVDLLQQRITELTLEKYAPDVLIEVSKDAAGTFEFYRSKDAITLGRETTRKALQAYELGK